MSDSPRSQSIDFCAYFSLPVSNQWISKHKETKTEDKPDENRGQKVALESSSKKKD